MKIQYPLRQRGKGRPTLAKPFVRVADHGHTPCRGARPRLGHLQGWQAMANPLAGAVDCDEGLLWGQSLAKGDCAARGQASRVAARGASARGNRQ
ncbi:hypothetical protein B296_00003826 [Ensete ventricosum]|uniref:Uncharacterized protein n=1 Tax=Ensete ventricosum TaxID=4639 RepID=A0A426Y104_ENSVE|nr:hypothetical protein B296_00003826 [Ensete ventricosum]